MKRLRGLLPRGSILLFVLALAGHAPAGEPERPIPISEWLKRSVDEAPLALRFKGGTAEECVAWQKEFAIVLRQLLGPHTPPQTWKTIVLQATYLEDHRREELLLIAEGFPPLPVYVLVPRAKSAKRRPAILALHGHGAFGHHPIAGRDDLPGVANAIKNNHYDYGRQLVRQGYIVVAPCLTPFGDRLGKSAGKADLCADTFIRMQMLGKTLMGENLRDCLWAIELLARRQDVDPNRLGCVGLSYGGRMTMLTTALEPRIKVCAISGALNAMQERIRGPYGCGAQIIPGLLQYGDVPEIASLIAPRACVWEVGSRDKLIEPLWAEEILTRQRRAYRSLGATEQLKVDRFEGGHVWNGTMASVLLKEVLHP